MNDDTTIARFFSLISIDADTGCWHWQGTRQPTGYGKWYVKGHRSRGAHRLAWEILRGAIPEGMDIDHLCKNRACVNPDHLEPVTHAENKRRDRKTHCINGHALSGSNRMVGTDGYPRCRTCRANARKARAAARHLGSSGVLGTQNSDDEGTESTMQKRVTST